MNKTFKYQGHEFEAIGNVIPNCCLDFKWDTKFNNEEKFSIKGFYEVAEKNHLDCDLYKIDGGDTLWVLAGPVDSTGYFYQSITYYKKGSKYGKLKLIEEYERKYKNA